MVVPHSGGYPHAKFEGNLLLFKFGPLTKSGLTIPQCAHGDLLFLPSPIFQLILLSSSSALLMSTTPTALISRVMPCQRLVRL